MYSASELLCEQPHVFTYTAAVPGTKGDDDEETGDACSLRAPLPTSLVDLVLLTLLLLLLHSWFKWVPFGLDHEVDPFPS